MQDVVHCTAPAKVNLTLAVQGRRADGYHNLASWVAKIDLADRIALRTTDSLSISVSGAYGAPADETNLAWRAAVILAEAVGRRADVHISIEKHIPAGAGLGGGSSDAAATLLGLVRLWEIKWPPARLQSLAASLGADVPLFLWPGSAVIRGRGEIVEPVNRAAPPFIVLIVPPFSLGTAGVYAGWQRHATASPADRPALPQATQDADQLQHALFNDLAAAAFAIEPRLAQLHNALDGCMGRRVTMSGSGSSLFAVFDDASAAAQWKDAAVDVLPEPCEVKIVRTLNYA